VPDRGRRVAVWMNGIVSSVRDTVADVTDSSTNGRRPRVALLEWIDPIMGSGHWCNSELFAHASQPFHALRSTASGSVPPLTQQKCAGPHMC
jgi:hypothetical protein